MNASVRESNGHTVVGRLNLSMNYKVYCTYTAYHYTLTTRKNSSSVPRIHPMHVVVIDIFRQREEGILELRDTQSSVSSEATAEPKSFFFFSSSFKENLAQYIIRVQILHVRFCTFSVLIQPCLKEPFKNS